MCATAQSRSNNFKVFIEALPQVTQVKILLDKCMIKMDSCGFPVTEEMPYQLQVDYRFSEECADKLQIISLSLLQTLHLLG